MLRAFELNHTNIVKMSDCRPPWLRRKIVLQIKENGVYLHSTNDGALAEWLGTGLQNQAQWFDSATHLQQMPLRYLRGIFNFKFSYNFPTN